MAHLMGWDVRRHLNRVFGFARWSADLTSLDLLYEDKTQLRNGKPGWAVAYRATVRLTVCAPDGTVLATYTEAAAGSGMPQPDYMREEAHDMAIKTAETQALKRAAVNLGTMFGLSLYNQGDTRDVTLRTLVDGEATT
jgi:recombination DNA repair RAD52 pathway protein